MATTQVIRNGKAKLSYKECCKKWGREAMEAQMHGGTKHFNVPKDLIAANVFAFCPPELYHKYYVARIGWSPSAIQLIKALEYGEYWSFTKECTYCTKCFSLVDEHVCTDCEHRFTKNSDNIADNKNQVARELGGWAALESANFESYQAALDDMMYAQTTAGFVLKQARELEKTLDRRSTYSEKLQVEELFSLHEEMQIVDDATLARIDLEENEYFLSQRGERKQPRFSPEEYDDVMIDTLATSITESASILAEETLSKTTGTLAVEDKVLMRESQGTGFFFGTIPSEIPLPVIESQTTVVSIKPTIMITPTQEIIKMDSQVGGNTESTVKEEMAAPIVKRQYVGPPVFPVKESKVSAGVKLIARKLHRDAEQLLMEYDRQCDVAFNKLAVIAQKDANRKALMKPIKQKSGGYTFRTLTKYDRKKLMKKEWRKKVDDDFKTAKPHIVTSLSIAGGIEASTLEVEESVKKPLNTTRSTKVKKVWKPVKLTKNQLDNLITHVAQIASRGEKKFEIIGMKKCVRGVYKKFKGNNHMFLQLRHMDGIRARQDLHLSTVDHTLVKKMATAVNWRKRVHLDALTFGASGLVLNPSMTRGKIGRTSGNMLIVRGRCDGILLDARSRVTESVMLRMQQYSDVANRFWRGFEKRFLPNRPEERTHVCEAELDVERCGEVAALTCQAIHPCVKITCKKCVTDLVDLSEEKLSSLLNRRVTTLAPYIRAQYPEFSHMADIIERFGRSAVLVNKNYDAYAEVQRLIGDRTNPPFVHLNKINNLLMKGGALTCDELASASDHLRELARYQNNRTENIEKGSITHFRNKISQRSHFNASLMCDNQLDKNGNFIWGERGYHAKRFFSNYFDLVEPSEGYTKYIVRKNPNGSRELAINNLIVSTNFERMRELMEGLPVKKHGISQQCVSKRAGNFVYPCSCVTLENGQPQESDLKLPTKNHLVIGNAGDPKYVDLPTEVMEKLYIAKEGYCYINIFLAMLVNVRESEAKDYTKRVRDIVVRKLGKWPTMIDVATACCLLAVFHPEVQDAELPRILVDHTTKTMHVIDSYGSKSTGYHILKANTVSQLMQFASDSLDSEMKHYVVGGHAHTTAFERASIRTIIKCVYKPHKMKELLETDPYMLLMAVLSPSVLRALHFSGSLEKALEYWIDSDQEVITILTTIHTLAKRVSVARTLSTQMQVVQTYASEMNGFVNLNRRASMAAVMAYRTMQHLRNKQLADGALEDQGFNNTIETCTVAALEKIYQKDLELQWHALKFCQKCYFMWQFMKRCKGLRTRGKEEHIIARAEEFIRYPSLCMVNARATSRFVLVKGMSFLRELQLKAKLYLFDRTLSLLRFGVPDVVRMANVLIIIGILFEVSVRMRRMLKEHISYKRAYEEIENDKKFKEVKDLYKDCVGVRGEVPTVDDFLEYVKENNPLILEYTEEALAFARGGVKHQAKSPMESKYERIIAMFALFMMVFDADRSDCVYKILNKLRTLTNIAQTDVYHQSLDEIKDEFNEKKMTIDFELDSESMTSSTLTDETFATWWSNQLSMNNVIPHYRTEGHFMEFTRATATAIAHEIATGPHRDFLIRGAVGSGKSTGLPYNLMRKGAVLLVEPTRPLAENVCKQLRGDPFNLNPTLKMRGMTIFGSSPITVMTSGYALHYLANNVKCLGNYQFIILDECHVNDSAAMAFRCLLHEHDFQGKILKVSATPPGRETEFTTQFPVKILVEEALSFQSFVAAQGSGQNADVITRGDNILVYVASYNDVDTLGKMLLDAGHRVTKVDGRTMKVGSVEIATYGTAKHKHFIVATNIIENGVTLDIDVVVDFGKKVSPFLDTDNRMITAGQVPISYGERIQRLGRVGRNKPGTALRIGWTEKGLIEIPAIVATEAALMCFTYGLPVMTHNVSTALLSGCTVRQASTMQHFELSPYFLVDLVRYDGTMHPAIHGLLKKYKLRDSEIGLNKLALPVGQATRWISVREYNRCARAMILDEDVRLPFLMHGIPDKLYEELWTAVHRYRSDVGFGRLTSASACKIAYTLKTDFTSLPRTVKLLDELIASEMAKQEYFRSVTAQSCSSSNFSLASALNAVRASYTKDHTAENIAVLQAAKAQIIELKNLDSDNTFVAMGDKALESYVKEFSASSCVQHQSKEALSRHLRLKGVWNKSLITRDVIVMGGVFVGGIYLIYESFKDGVMQKVKHQGLNKRQRQKLKFRDTRDSKLGREVYGDDGTIEHYFGTAYTAKGKTKGTKRGMGAKNRRFTNMYGYDPSDYAFVRFVDPLTGHTLDENIYADIELVQEHFGDIRKAYMSEDLLEPQKIMSMPGIQAFYMSNAADKALKVDLTPHNPLKVCDATSTIAGFPEQEAILRQTGQPEVVPATTAPKVNEYKPGEVSHESKSLFRGLRDYNPIASSVCQITNESDGHVCSTYGVGYGCVIITNQHLFKRNNGTLLIKSRGGEFRVQNTTILKMKPCKGRDVLILQLPKDFPPFPRRLTFRNPIKGERVCMIGSNFQEKSISSTVSESSTTYPVDGTHFWKHWIDTKDGQCGLPVVSPKDGAILGIHSLAGMGDNTNFFTDLPEDFCKEYLDNVANLDWAKAWRYNPVGVLWGSMQLTDSQPDSSFKTNKLITDLNTVQVYAQSHDAKWVLSALGGNLKAVCHCPSQLVTKHVVKGKCPMFELYLKVDSKAHEFFTPLMGAYQKSRLNKEAYKKDLFKYAEVTKVGDVNCTVFEQAITSVIRLLEKNDFGECKYITDESDIINSLNMKAAVGALYAGKKREYFQVMNDREKEELLRASCFRLYTGKLGVWNGSLKAELRPLEKVQANKTRTFTAAPLDTLLAGKVCVDDFNNRFYDLHIQCPWSVGMTKFYGGWNELLGRLPDGWVYCDADGSQFDSSLSPYLINAVVLLRLHFMEEWDIGEQMLRNLYTEITYTPILTPDGTIVKKHKGNNSGQPSTVVDNTLMVILAVHYTLLAEGLQLEEFDDTCRFFVNGDDLIIAIEPKHEHLLDKFSKHFADLGLKYVFDQRHRSKEDLWFMSHQGKPRDGVLIPKLEPERIVSILEWDRSTEPAHRMEAICAAMVEAWGYDELLHEIRRFYKWLLEQAPYNEFARNGGAPYIAESALRKLYTSIEPKASELEVYLSSLLDNDEEDVGDFMVRHQASTDELDAGRIKERKGSSSTPEPPRPAPTPDVSTSDKGKEVVAAQPSALVTQNERDRDINTGTVGTFSVPRLRAMPSKVRLPMVKSGPVLNLEHLLVYKPSQLDISNAKSTRDQFQRWYDGVKEAYEVDDSQMAIILDGLVVWCIENGTSPNINGVWVMMDGDDQVSYPIKPLVEFASPTFRQIMKHFSDVAEAYIQMRNAEQPYMPRYGLVRNLTDLSLARYAFDFYEVTSRTPPRAKEAYFQMKAAALTNVSNRLFGLDGNVSTTKEDTERHTANDVDRNIHTLLGMRGIH
ncbi:MAG: polyprotein [Rumex potyvirus 1]|nr:MAG: polyprotein [Rumex potyvirus 1]